MRKQYIEDYDEGLGTTFERFILHGFFEKINDRYSIKSVLEAPCFGITGISGINSMWWAAHEVPVTVVDCEEKRIQLIRKIWGESGLELNLTCQKNYDSLPFRNRSFDLSWNFCALRFIKDPERLLEEMARVTRKVIFICIPNRTGIASIIRGLFEKDVPGSRVDGDIGRERVTSVLQGLGWECWERGYFDVPPWPDIAMKKEEFLRKLGLGWLLPKKQKGDRRPLCILDYFKGDKDMERRVMKYSFLENSPGIFKKFWAHHEYLLFSPKKS